MIGKPEPLGLGAGVRITATSGRFATLGLLAVSAKDAIVGITVSTIAPAGSIFTAHAGEVVIELGPALQPSSVSPEQGSIETLISQIPIPLRLKVHSEFGGLEQAPDAIGARVAWGEQLWLVRPTERVGLGRLSALDATTFRRADGQQLIYHGALEVECPFDGLLMPGDAGAIVVSGRGQPVGIVTGARPGIVTLAPLHRYFESCQLTPLTILDASRDMTPFWICWNLRKKSSCCQLTGLLNMIGGWMPCRIPARAQMKSELAILTS